MLILLRKIRMQNETVVDQHDEELQAAAIRVGSDRAQDLQLFGPDVGPEHCVLQPQPDGGLHVECRGQHQVTVAERDVGRATVERGEWVQIGTHRLAPVEAPPGFDAAIEVRVDIEATESIRDRWRVPLALKVPRLRPYSYALALLVGVLGFGLPILGFYYGGVDRALERQPLPSDQFWSTGPLSDPHHLPGMVEDCTVCHAKPFQRVTNAACMDCHSEVAAHFAAAHPVAEGFNERCSSCHKEHNEPPNLIVRHEALCTDCHRDTLQRMVEAAPPVASVPVVAAPASVPPVTAFGADRHPEFLATVLRLSEGEWGVSRQRLDGGARESSHLKFPHDVHLDADKVSAADGLAREERALLCRDCHQLQREGEHFEPVTMETTCRACHSLAFDAEQPGRQLPHAQPDVVQTYLEEFYVRQAAQQRHATPAAPQRRVPASQPERRCEGDPLECGLRWAGEEMERLFTDTGCVNCHDVHRQNGGWRVDEVRLVGDWYPAARFDHRPHLNPGVARGESCTDCHEAQTSSHSEDVLMPGLENCVDCHGEGRGSNVALQCVDCHGFHRPGLPNMKEL